MGEHTVREGDVLWEPDEETRSRANLTAFLRWLKDQRGLSFPDYQGLWEWSVGDLEGFWESIWNFFGVRAVEPYRRVLADRRMPGARWFEGARLNYVEHVFRGRDPDGTALLFASELRPLASLTWAELARQVGAVAGWLRSVGVGPGDRVVSYMPNIPETIVAFLAAASLGAVWSSCSPDFGIRSVVDRFRQIEPEVLFVVDGYRYGGKVFHRRNEVGAIRRALPTLRHVVEVPYLGEGRGEGCVPWDDVVRGGAAPGFEPVAFDHPLWIVYSSGTTGLPKALVHGHGGILLEFLKFLGLHLDLHPGDRFFWFSTTGWIMWNILQGGLLLGATPVLFDGNPGYPDMDRLWDLAERAGVTYFGAGAPFLLACKRAGLRPGRDHDLAALRAVGSTGSPLPVDGFTWVYEAVGRRVWLGSVSGGTDVATAFLGSCPLLPVRAGELQCRCLGVKAEALDEAGNPLVGEVGELVISEPMPSMPLYLWGDPDGSRYRQSYFAMYPGRWRHGDWVRITEHGGAVVLGRSDSTLKRMGVRMGSAEFYGVVEALPEVEESLVVGVDLPDGGYLMILFVVPGAGVEFDTALEEKIRQAIRTALSPRHLPDRILPAPGIPRTLNGKKMEVPVKKILMGFPADRAVNPDSMANPGSIAFFVDLARQMGTAGG